MLKLEQVEEDDENDEVLNASNQDEKDKLKIKDNIEPEQIKIDKIHKTNSTTNMDDILLQAFNNLTISFQTTKALRINSLKSAKQNTREWFDMFDRHTANWDDSSMK